MKKKSSSVGVFVVGAISLYLLYQMEKTNTYARSMFVLLALSLSINVLLRMIRYWTGRGLSATVHPLWSLWRVVYIWIRGSFPQSIADRIRLSDKIRWLETYVQLQGQSEGLPTIPFIDDREIEAVSMALSQKGISPGPHRLLKVQVRRLMLEHRGHLLWKALVHADPLAQQSYDWKYLLEIFSKLYQDQAEEQLPLFYEMLSTTLGFSWLPSIDTLKLSLLKAYDRSVARERASELFIQVKTN